MKCPKCNCLHTKVTDTRMVLDHICIRRRRKCMKCGHKFSTMEVYCKTELVVLKRNGINEDFDSGKIMQGLQKAVKSDGVKEEKIEILMRNILRHIQDYHAKQISSEKIGQIVMEELKQIDTVAYLRFVSVHKNFHEAHEFEQEVKNLESNE